MKAAIYARVSTTDQTNTIQVRELKEYVERRGWQIAGIYQDQMSGAKASRPGLDQLMADARLRKFDAVLVWKLDRFGRSLVHCVSGIQELASLGIRFLAISQGLDTDESNPASKLLMHILAAVAQFERELIRERVSAGMRAAKTHGTKTGNAIGRPRRVFDREEVVRLRSAGLSFEKISRQMRVGVGTVVRVLEAVGATSASR
jgi:DNA invertase Pin-like site-specific DNA recombinase